MKLVIFAVLVFVLGALVGHGITPLGRPDVQTSDPGFEQIGPKVIRTDDRERGVSCYRLPDDSALSCVLTGVGQESSEPEPTNL